MLVWVCNRRADYFKLGRLLQNWLQRTVRIFYILKKIPRHDILGGRGIRGSTEERLVDLLTRAGLPRNLGRTLVFLAAKGETTSVEAEKGIGIRQPEVSIAMKELRQRGWVTKRDVKKEGKGRPLHAYRLAVSFSKVVDEIVEAEMGRMKEAEANLKILQRKARTFSSP